jgi:hypothetical protein
MIELNVSGNRFWLSLGSRTLPASDEIPVIGKFVEFDASQAGTAGEL